jgi:hypothetical protein
MARYSIEIGGISINTVLADAEMASQIAAQQGATARLLADGEAPPMGQMYPRTLSDLRAAAHALRTAERMRREATTYPHAETRFDADERSMIRWGLVVSMALLAIGSAPDAVIVPSGWRDTHGTPMLYTAAQILAAQQSLLLWGALCDGASQAIAAEIDTAAAIADLDAILAAIQTDPRWPE